MTFLARNASKTVPLTLVLILAVLLVFGIVSLINSIPLSIRTIYGAVRFAGFIDPRGDPAEIDKLKKIAETESPVPIQPIFPVRVSSIMVRSLVGKWDFVILAMDSPQVPAYLERVGAADLQGRLPRPGQPEMIISDPIARNLGLKLGDIVLSPDNSEAYSPNPVRVVGILPTQEWIMVADREYYRKHHLPPVDVLVIMTRDPAKQAQFDVWAKERFSGLRARVTSYTEIRKQSDESFEVLYKILNVVIGMLVLVVTIMMGMLMNIYQGQRLQEFALLQALGYTKSTLLRRVLQESALVVVLGWLLGVLVSLGILSILKASLFDPRAFSMHLLDARALAYTLPIPIAIFGAAWLTVWLRFRAFDPVGIVDRRIV